MNLLVYIVIFAWIILVIYLFRRFSTSQALISSMIIAWLFLPEVNIALPAIPDLTKINLTTIVIFLAALFYDWKGIKYFRPSYIDIPMLIWCVCPLVSSLTNNLGWYDGLSSVLLQTITWGIPYFLGRVYLNSLATLRQLAIGIFIGGLIYIPFCLIENLIRPQLNWLVYGFYTYDDIYIQAFRLGGWRPIVFMKHGLMLSIWMMASLLTGIWLWFTKALNTVWNIPLIWLVTCLSLTFVLTRSTGAYLLFLLGIFILFCVYRINTTVPIVVIIILIVAYVFIKLTGTFPRESIVSFLSEFMSGKRLQSINFRFLNEELIFMKARQSMLWGWGGWGRFLDIDHRYAFRLVPDSLWIIVFGDYGLIGVISWLCSQLLPVFWFSVSKTYSPNSWSHHSIAPTAILVVILILYLLDCLLNAMINPIYILAGGGITGLMYKTITNRNC